MIEREFQRPARAKSERLFSWSTCGSRRSCLPSGGGTGSGLTEFIEIVVSNLLASRALRFAGDVAVKRQSARCDRGFNALLARRFVAPVISRRRAAVRCRG